MAADCPSSVACHNRCAACLVQTGAADGFARMSGVPAIALLHLGPGLANGEQLDVHMYLGPSICTLYPMSNAAWLTANATQVWQICTMHAVHAVLCWWWLATWPAGTCRLTLCSTWT